MQYCTKCGSEIPEGAKFCMECGKEIASQTERNTRRNEYAGSVKKCPACGEEISSFVAICPACGHEFNSSKVANSLQEFINEIGKLDQVIETGPKPEKKGWSSWSNGQKVAWVILNICTYCIPLIIYMLFPLLTANSQRALSPEEKRKASYIQNYAFPNEREAILEALLFIKSKMDFLLTEKYDRKTVFWGNLWTIKADQLYKKADILFKNDQVAIDTYTEIKSKNKQLKRIARIRIALICTLLVTVVILLGTRYFDLSAANKNPVSQTDDSLKTVDESESSNTYPVENDTSEDASSQTDDLLRTVDESENSNIYPVENDISEDALNYIDRNNLTINNFSFALSDCWVEDGSKTDYKQYYAETGNKVAMLSIAYPEDEEDIVSLELLYDDNENMIHAIENMYDSCEVNGYEYYESDYGVSGILYSFQFIYKAGLVKSYSSTGYLFCFPSLSDNRWYYVSYLATDNIDGDYTEDYMKFISSISEVQ